MSNETNEICKLFNIDPYITLGEGAMLVTCMPENTVEVLEAIHRKGTEAEVIGQLVDKRRGVVCVSRSGETVLQNIFLILTGVRITLQLLLNGTRE